MTLRSQLLMSRARAQGSLEQRACDRGLVRAVVAAPRSWSPAPARSHPVRLIETGPRGVEWETRSRQGVEGGSGGGGTGRGLGVGRDLEGKNRVEEGPGEVGGGPDHCLQALLRGLLF